MREAIENLRVDHLGIQVSDLSAAIETFTRLLGYRQATLPVKNTRHQVEVVFLEKDGSLPLKLFRSMDGLGSPTPRLHHIALRTDEISEAVKALVAAGARLLHAPAPGEAFDNEPIAFLFAGGLNLELVSTDKRHARISGQEPGALAPGKPGSEV